MSETVRAVNAGRTEVLFSADRTEKLVVVRDEVGNVVSRQSFPVKQNQSSSKKNKVRSVATKLPKGWISFPGLRGKLFMIASKIDCITPHKEPGKCRVFTDDNSQNEDGYKTSCVVYLSAQDAIQRLARFEEREELRQLEENELRLSRLRKQSKRKRQIAKRFRTTVQVVSA